MLIQIQKRYHDYLQEFQEDVKWLSDKEFYRDDEEVSGKTRFVAGWDGISHPLLTSMF